MSKFVDELKKLLHEAGAMVVAGEEKLKLYVESAVKAHEDNKDLPTPTPAAATGSVPYMGAAPITKNQRPLPIQRVDKAAGVTVESSPPPVSTAGHAVAADGTDLGTGQKLSPSRADIAAQATGRLGDESQVNNSAGTKIIVNQQENVVTKSATNDQLTHLPSLPHNPPGNDFNKLSYDNLLEDVPVQRKRALEVEAAIAKLTPAQQSSSHLPQQRDDERSMMASINHALTTKGRDMTPPVIPSGAVEQFWLTQAAAKGWS